MSWQAFKIHIFWLIFNRIQFISEYNSLNFQINNAGCMVNTREVTEDGLEKNFATNTQGKKML